MASQQTARVLPESSAVDQETLWHAFAGAAFGDDFAGSWLALQCARIAGTRVALVLFEDADSTSLAPIAAWPAQADFSPLQQVAERAMAAGEGVVDRAGNDAIVRVAYPIEIDGHVCGLVLLELTADDAGVQLALRELHWGIGWLEAQILRRRANEEHGKLERAGFALDVLAVASEHDRLEAAAQGVVNELALRLACDRAALGLAAPGRPIRLLALSNAAWFRRRARLVASLENAMEEARDQAATIAWPEIAGLPRGISVAHRTHLQDQGAGALLSVVLRRRGVPLGALTLERGAGKTFDRDTVRSAEAVAELLGPLLELERRQRRWLSGRLPDALHRTARKLFGPRHPALKLGVVAAIAVALLLVLWQAPFRISARATLEGAQQRVAAAPFQGFVASAKARPGDEVHRGDVLAELDDQDLRLDMTKWRAEYARLSQEKRKALAAMDRAEAALVDAQLEQARAQVELTTIKLERARILAPIDGMIVSGDWSQKLGAPVEQGATMFEIGTLESYRVNLQVEEADVRYVEVGQSGHVLLAGRADAALPFVVTRVTAVASVEDGQNGFRAEARLTEAGSQIRPGMEGVGKIDIGMRSVGWIWTRRLVDWARLVVWRFLP